MGIPTINDLVPYKDKAINKGDWNQLQTNVIGILTDGTKDISVNKVTANEYSGIESDEITGLLAGESISAAGLLLRWKASDNKVYLADNTTVAGVTSIIGFSAAAYSAGDSTTVNRRRRTDVTVLTPGATYYCGTSGAITSTRPAANAVVVGIAYSATDLRVERSAGDNTNVHFWDKWAVNGNKLGDINNAKAWHTDWLVIHMGGNGYVRSNITPAAGNSIHFGVNSWKDTDGTNKYISTDEAVIARACLYYATG